MTSAPRLRPDRRLQGIEIAGSTMAQIAPAFSFYFGMAVIAGAAGLAAPLVILVAGGALAIVGLSLAAFAQHRPSAGSLVTYLGLAFGGVVGVATALVFTLAYVLLLAAVMLVAGGWVSDSLNSFYGIHVSWVLLTVVFAAISAFLALTGIDRSTKVATAAMVVEVAILVLVSAIALVKAPHGWSWAPLSPAHLSNGLAGLGLAFPLAVFMFVGFENSVALAEETENPRRTIPRAVLLSIGLMGLLYVVTSYATVTGFGNDLGALSQSQIPFMDLATKYLGGFAILAALAGFTSAFGTLLAGSNNVSRVIFNSAREGLFPSRLANVSPRWGTPDAALLVPYVLAFVLALGVALPSGGWLNGFTYLSTLGSIPLFLLYGALNLAVMRYSPLGLSPLRRWVLPAVGLLAIGAPVWALVEPGQPAPFSWFPWLIAGLILLAVLYSWRKVLRDPQLPGRIGASVPDEGADERVVEPITGSRLSSAPAEG